MARGPTLTPAISTEGLSKKYRSRLAVDGLDLEVSRGAVFGFLGANGAGKTTTIRMLLGLTRPTSGRASIFDSDIPAELPKVAGVTASVLEDPSFYPQMSGRKNLATLALMTSDRAALDRIDEALEQVKLKDRADDRVGRYSRGMRQRLALAATLMRDPDLYVLDEPATGLDPPGVRDIRDLLVRLKEAGKTVFFSSHSLSEVERVCDEVAIINRGKVIQAGKLGDLVSAAPAVRVLVDDPAAAIDLARKKGWKAQQEGDSLLLEGVSSEEANAALVSSGIHPKELSPVRRDLEEVFLELTAEDDGS